MVLSRVGQANQDRKFIEGNILLSCYACIGQAGSRHGPCPGAGPLSRKGLLGLKEARDGTPRRKPTLHNLKAFQEKATKERLWLWQYGCVESNEGQVPGAREIGGRQGHHGGSQLSTISKLSRRKQRKKGCGFGNMDVLNPMRGRFQVQEKLEGVSR